jgi:hypothetical protein
MDQDFLVVALLSFEDGDLFFSSSKFRNPKKGLWFTQLGLLPFTELANHGAL